MQSRLHSPSPPRPVPPPITIYQLRDLSLLCVSEAKHTGVLHLNPGPCASFQPLPLLAWALTHPSGPDCEPVLHGQLYHRAQGTQHDPFSFSCTDSTHIQGHIPPYTLPPGLCTEVLENASQLLVYLRALWLSDTSSTLPASSTSFGALSSRACWLKREGGRTQRGKARGSRHLLAEAILPAETENRAAHRGRGRGAPAHRQQGLLWRCTPQLWSAGCHARKEGSARLLPSGSRQTGREHTVVCYGWAGSHAASGTMALSKPSCRAPCSPWC